MTRLPPKRVRPRSGIRDEETRRVYQTHRMFLRGHQCVVPECVEGPIEVSHIRNAANSGIGIKPRDDSATPMCRIHHMEYHSMGHETFQAKYKIDLYALAEEFVKLTTDKALRKKLEENRNA